ncbi:MAG: hypothetical protein EBQ80_00805 [Proteobacteria bacterium]|nr:hypothetical protein [Pseudomonadota bacterium]
MHSRHPASTFNPAIQGWSLTVTPGQWQVCESGTHLTATLASTIALIIHDSANQRLALANFMVEPTAPNTWNNSQHSNSHPSPHADALLADMWQALKPPPEEGALPKLSGNVVGGATSKSTSPS